MTTLNLSSKKKSPLVHRWLIIIFLCISFIGFLDASYLTISHYQREPLSCNNTISCDVVTTSSYSTIIGIPVALLGAMYYIIAFFMAFYIYIEKKESFVLPLVSIVPIGLVASLWFIYVQLFILHEICMYCMISASASIFLFLLGMYMWKLSSHDNKKYGNT